MITSNILTSSKKFVIFLDIDGVLYLPPDNSQHIRDKVDQLFPDYKLKESHYDNYVCSIAASHFFDKEALKNLDFLIESKLKELYEVQIVISSSWRTRKTVDQLKIDFFGIHNFSKYIVDKTHDYLSIQKNHCKWNHKDRDFSNCRASEIIHWLNEHPEITDYVVIDDDDSRGDMLKAFGDKFIKTEYTELLTSDHIFKFNQIKK